MISPMAIVPVLLLIVQFGFLHKRYCRPYTARSVDTIADTDTGRTGTDIGQ